MKKSLQEKLNQFYTEYVRRKRWQKVVISLCAVVAVGTAIVLINPATTKVAETYCGLEKHLEHTDECYKEVPVLVCPFADNADGEHVHTDECYEMQRELVCGKPIHDHSLQCFSDPEADVEDASVWEQITGEAELTGDWPEDVLSVAKTQLGYQESTRNYEVQEDGATMHGYTRYGDWYGLPYGDWCAMFCSFVMHYAGVTEDAIPFAASCENWIEQLKDPEYDLFRPAHNEPKHIERSEEEIDDEYEYEDDEYEYDEYEYEDEDDLEEPEEITAAEAPAETGTAEEDRETAEEIAEVTEIEEIIEEGEPAEETGIEDVTEQEDSEETVMETEAAAVAPVQHVREEVIPRAAAATPSEAVARPVVHDSVNTATPSVASPSVPGQTGPAGPGSGASDEEYYIPKPGDLIFFDWDSYGPSNPEREADHVGFVAELIYDAATGAITRVKTIEGNSGNTVKYNIYDITDITILGYGEMPEGSDRVEQTIESLPASDGAVAVISGLLPEGAEAVIDAVVLTEEELIMYFGPARAAAMTGYVAYDIRIMVDGEEWQPDEYVSVTVRQTELTAEKDENIAVAHVDDNTSEITDMTGGINKEGEISFDAEGFSLYIFYTFTVDFHYEGRTCSIPGMSSISLSDLFAALGIDEDAGEVLGAVFSDETLVAVSQNEDGEWILTSLKMFDTNETLTLEFSDGRVLELAVTDANATLSASWNGSAVVITATGRSTADNQTEYLKISQNSNNYSITVAEKTVSKKNTDFTITATLPGSATGSEKIDSSARIGLLYGETVEGTGFLNLLDQIPKPEGQTALFQDWLRSYSGAQETLSDLLAAYEAYQSSGDITAMPPLPEGMSVTWDDNTRTAVWHYEGTVTKQKGTIKLILEWPSGTYNREKILAKTSGVIDVNNDYELNWTLINGQSTDSFTRPFYGIRVINSDTTSHDAIEQTFTQLNRYLSDGTDGNVVLRLLNYIMPDVSHFNYGEGNDIFTSWLKNVYLNNPEYGRPTVIPTKQSDVATAYHYFIAGVKADGSPVYTVGVPKETVMTEPAGEFTIPSLGDFSKSSVSKKIDWQGDEGVSGKEDLYRLYLDFTAAVKPIDLLLVVDQSGSMKSTLSGGAADDTDDISTNDSRQKILTDFLNGTNGDGFISQFMSNKNNHLAIVTFGSDSNSDVPTAEKPNGRYKYQWGDRDTTVDLPDSGVEGATNYAAALKAADDIWKKLDDDPVLGHTGNPRIMIFLSDGEPTVTYKDGKMHTGFDAGKNDGGVIIGTGDAGVFYTNFNTRFYDFISALCQDAQAVKNGAETNFRENREKFGLDNSFTDDNGDAYTTSNCMITSDDSSAPSFPMVADFKDVTVDDIPGISSLFGGFVDENGNPDTDASTFLDSSFLKWYQSIDPMNWYLSYTDPEIAKWYEGGFINNQFHEASEVNIYSYNLFELSKSAFKQYQEAHPGILTYSIGFGDSVSGTYADGVTAKDEVLKYMTGEEGVATENCKRFYHCGAASTLIATFKEITQMSNVVMTDILSDNVTPVDTPNLNVTLVQGTGSDAVTTTLVSNGTLTADGWNMLDVANVTGLFTTVGGKTVLQIPFKDTVIFTDDIKLSAEFTVKTTEAAKKAYIKNRYSYPDIGDIDKTATGNDMYITDHDLRSADTITSSGKAGLYSNEESVGADDLIRSGVTWTYRGDRHDEFPMPVVQLAEEPERPLNPTDLKSPEVFGNPEIHKTIDYLGDNDGTKDTDNPDTTLDDHGVTGLEDLYRLYLDAKDATDPINLLLVIDRSNSMYLEDEDMTDSEGNAHTRMEVLLEFLNGKEDDCSDGFIQQFLNANDKNLISAITFGQDCGAPEGTRYVIGYEQKPNPYYPGHTMDDRDKPIYGTFSDYLIPWTNEYTGGEIDLPQIEEYGATNYTAAYQVASEMVAALNDEDAPVKPAANSETYVLFLSDGVPTYAYADGKMQNGLNPADTFVFGTGNDNNNTPVTDDLVTLIDNIYWAYTYEDCKCSPDDPYYPDEISTSGGYAFRDSYYDHSTDHTGEAFEARDVYTDIIIDYGDENTYGFPVGYSWKGAPLDLSSVGISYDKDEDDEYYYYIANLDLLEEFEEVMGDYIDWEPITGEQIEYLTNVKTCLQAGLEGPYDLFQMTENSYDDFKRQIGEDINVIAVGFSNEFLKTYTDSLGNKREADEVLKYMSRNSGKYGGYVIVPTAQDLVAEINKLFLVKDPTISDELSADVDVYDPSELVVYREPGLNGEERTYLYRNGALVTDAVLGEENVLESVTLTPAVRDASGNITENGKLVVDFKEDFALDNHITYTASFNIKVEESTKANFTSYPNRGDSRTDFGTNRTSSEQPGFYSNTDKKATFDWGPYEKDPDNPGEQKRSSKEYPHPVVQVQKEEPVDPVDPIVPVEPDPVNPPELPDDGVSIGKKIDWLGDNEDVTGMDDLYRLYLELEAEEQPIDLLLVLDQSGSMNWDMDGDPKEIFDPVQKKLVPNPDYDEDKVRQNILMDFLNGENNDGTGFINDFLSTNENNKLAVLTFGATCTMNDNYIRSWTSTDKTVSSTANGATNYMAALDVADQIWADEAVHGDVHRKIMIFLGDGVATKAFKDGKLHGITDERKTIGNGTEDCNRGTIISTFGSFMSDLYTDAYWDYSESQQHNLNRQSGVDNLTYVTAYPDVPPRGQNSFPVMIDLADIEISIPGLTEYPLGDFTNNGDPTEFLNWFNDIWLDYNSEEQQAWFDTNLVSLGTYYDLFWLSESAFKEFADAHDGKDAEGNTVTTEDIITTYSIGYSADTDGTINGHDKAEVLKYMTGEKGKTTAQCERFKQCNDAQTLAKTINEIAMLNNIHMADKLSNEVEFAADPQFEITLTDENYDTEAYSGIYPYLYKEGAFTELGEALLLTAADPADATKPYTHYNTETGEIDVVFKPEIGFNEDMKVEAAFNIRVTDEAVEAWSENGQQYLVGPEGEEYTPYGDINTNGATDEEKFITDRDLRVTAPSEGEESTITSSGKPGYWSNDNEKAIATWKRGGEPGKENFPKPVVQVPSSVTIKLRKTDAETGNPKVLSGAVFDLYRQCRSTEQGAIQVPGGTESEYYVKVNADPIQCNGTDTEVKDLVPGTYYLIETTAPAGYILPARLLKFEITSSMVLESPDPDLVVNPDEEDPDKSDPLLLRVINHSGYELPETGGSGTTPFTLCGLLLMSTALMFGFSMRRKRERRRK